MGDSGYPPAQKMDGDNHLSDKKPFQVAKNQLKWLIYCIYL